MSTKKDFVNYLGENIEDQLCSETDSHGLMCPEDKVKLAGIETGATKNIVDSALSTTSTNAIQNNVVTTELNTKPGKIVKTVIDEITTYTGEVFNDEENVADGDFSHAEGSSTEASGNFSHAEGAYALASGNFSHVEGDSTRASGRSSHAEGESTEARGRSSHAEGESTKAIGDYSHAEGSGTSATGHASHAEGSGTSATGYASHAEGLATSARSDYQHVMGKFNEIDNGGVYAFIIGNGTSGPGGGSNAFAVDWSGNIYSGSTDLEILYAELQVL